MNTRENTQECKTENYGCGQGKIPGPHPALCRRLVVRGLADVRDPYDFLLVITTVDVIIVDVQDVKAEDVFDVDIISVEFQVTAADEFDLNLVPVDLEFFDLVRHGGPCVQGEHRHRHRANRQYHLDALHHATSSLCYRNPLWVATKERLPPGRSFGYGEFLPPWHGRLSYLVLGLSCFVPGK